MMALRNRSISKASLVAVLVGSGLLAVPAPAAEDPAVAAARALYDKGDFKAARAAFEPLVARHPEDGILRHQLGVCLEMTGDRERGKKARLEAIGKLEKLAAAAKPSIAVLYYLAGDYQLSGNAEQTRAVVDRALKLWSDKKIDPATPSETYQLASLVERAGRKDEAMALFKKALDGLRVTPDANRRYLSDVLVRVGNESFEKKDEAAALKSFEEARTVDPANPAPWYVHGVVLDGQKKLDEAQKDYEKAIALDPGHFYAQFNLANLLARKGKIPEAIAGFEKAAAANPAPDDLARTYEALAKLCEAAGRLRQASEYYGKLGKVKPSVGAELASRYALAHALEQEGKPDEALATLKDLLSHAPDVPQLHAEIAGILMDQKKYPEATTELLSAIALAPGEGGLYLALGRAYKAQGKVAEAQGAFKKALAREPTKGEAQKELDLLAAPPDKGPAR